MKSRQRLRSLCFVQTLLMLQWLHSQQDWIHTRNYILNPHGDIGTVSFTSVGLLLYSHEENEGGVNQGSREPLQEEEGAVCLFAGRTGILPSHSSTWHFDNSSQIRMRNQLFGAFFFQKPRVWGKKKMNCRLKHLTLKADCFKIIYLWGSACVCVVCVFSFLFFFFKFPFQQLIF